MGGWTSRDVILKGIKRAFSIIHCLGSEDIFPVKHYESVVIFSQIYPNFSNGLQTKTLSVYLVTT